MPPAPLKPADVALAEDIVSELNSRFSALFEAERTWVPDWDTRVELETLQVAVQPSLQPTGERWERADEPREIWPIDVGFAKRLTAKDRGEIDDLLRIVDDVREFLQFQRFELPAPDGRVFLGQGYQFLTRFDPELISRQLVGNQIVYAGSFLSVVRFPFELVR